MYDLVRPKIAVPTHGEARHIHEHAKFARAQNVKETVEAKNGSVILLKEGKANEIGIVQSGYIAVDGGSLIPSDSPIFKMRRRIRDEGSVVVSVVISKNNQLMAAPSISALGSMDPVEDREVINILGEEIEAAVERVKPKDTNEKISEAIRKAMRSVFKEELGKKPVIDVHVIRV
jgi:ribonuclease J